MPNFCAAPNCTRKSTQSNLAFFRFPRDPERCRLWVENCRRADLETKTPDQLNKHYRLCAKHFEPAMICKTSPYRTVLRETAVPTIFDLTSHLNNPHSRHRKRIKELTDEDIRRIKERRLESSIEQLHSKSEHACVEEEAEVERGADPPALSQEQREEREYMRALMETLLLMGRQGIPLGGSGEEEQEEEGGGAAGAFVPSNLQALLEARLGAGDAALRRRLEGVAVNEEFCPPAERQRVLAFLEGAGREALLREVRDASFFSLLTGEPADFPAGTRLPVFLRFVDQEGALREELAGLLPMPGGDGDGDGDGDALAGHLEAQVTQVWGLRMEHCRGQAHSASGSFSGRVGAAARRLSSRYPMAVHTPQSCCALNVLLARRMPLGAVRAVVVTLGEVQGLLRAEAGLGAELERVAAALSQGSPERARERQERRRAWVARWPETHDAFEVAAELLEPLTLCLDAAREDAERRWDDRLARRALAVSEALSDFQFVATLVILKNALAFTRAFGRNLQGETLDVFFAANSLTAVLHALAEVLDNVEVYHEFWFEEAVTLAATLGVSADLPRPFLLRQPAPDAATRIRPEAYFKDHLTLPIMHFVIQEVKDMFSENHLRALRCLSLVPAVMGHMKFNTSEEAHAHGYRGDLPNPDTLPAELHCWRIKWKHRGREVPLPASIRQTLQLSDVKFFPNVNAFLRVLSTLPLLRGAGGGAGGAQQRLHAYLDSTPARQRSTCMALLHTNQHLLPDLDQMAAQYTQTPEPPL
ncbi:hypothetical protein ACEWY4_018430 [Coilia grayii]|uniref:THAP-type domain-containing protein n=1 Tax=Coilia grayii TaxID=363190 RepID=A0ABD1JFG2_9TELE